MNPIDTLMTRFSTTRGRFIASAVFGIVGILFLALGFIPNLASLMITVFGSTAGVFFAAAGILVAANIPALARHQYRLYTRRITSLSVFAGWIVLSSLISRNDVVAEHLGGALMVAVVLGLLAFSSKTAEEIEESRKKDEEEQTEDIFDDYDEDDTSELSSDDIIDETR